MFKGLLDLDGELTPILASLVRVDPQVNSVLDDSSAAASELQSMKLRLHALMSIGTAAREAGMH